MSTVKEIILSMFESMVSTFKRADNCYKLVLSTLVALIIASLILLDFVYASYGVVLFLLVYNAEYWKQKSEFYKQLLDEKESKDASH